MVNYGGDEVSAIVVDIGSSSIRAGYAGDDAPKAVVPAHYGFVPEATLAGADVTMEDAGTPPAPPSAKMFVGSHGPALWRANMHVRTPIHTSLIEDFTPIPPLLVHALKDVLGSDPAEHPLLATEPAWNTPANRERLAEIAFEELGVPAFFIANTGVLNAFAAGKGTALVIDIGKSQASVTPVVDGFVLRKGMQYSNIPELIHAHARHIIASSARGSAGILLPHQLIASKMPVEPAMPPQFAIREDRMPLTTASWTKWAEEREVDEWLQSMGGVLSGGFNEQMAASKQARQYEFPNGYNTFYGPERYRLGESFFSHLPGVSSGGAELPKTVTMLISGALTSLDADLRQQLLQNVVLTGGGSLFPGLGERLNDELVRHYPGVKMHAPGNPTERRYGGWLGGSILASLGTFHQLWISQEEWKEHGRPIVAQRCK